LRVGGASHFILLDFLGHFTIVHLASSPEKKQRKPWGNAAMPKIPKSTLDFPQMFVLITSIFFWRYLEFHRVTKMLDHIFSTKPVEDPGYYRNNIQNIVPYLDTDKLSATVLELSVPKSH